MIKMSSPHTHTCFVDGKNTAREMIESAIKKGLGSIGFSEHSYVDHDIDYCLTAKQTKVYIEEIKRLKREFKDKIKIYLGIECDKTSNIDLTPYEYVIGSVHYLKDKKTGKFWSVDSNKQQIVNCCNEVYNGDYMALAKDYYSEIEKMAEKIKPDIIAHYDLITKFNDDLFNEQSKEYQSIAKKPIKNILKTGAIFEINSGAVFRGNKNFPYPNSFLINYLNKLNAPIIISSDAHCTDALGFYWDEMVSLLKNNGFNKMKVLNDKFDKIASCFDDVLI